MKKTSKLNGIANTKKLQLGLEPIRELDTPNLAQVVGGMQRSDIPQTNCRTCSCWDC